MAIHPIAGETFHSKLQIWTLRWHYRTNQGITMDFSTKCHRNSSNSCWDVSVWAKVVDRPNNIAIPRAMLLASMAKNKSNIHSITFTEFHSSEHLDRPNVFGCKCKTSHLPIIIIIIILSCSSHLLTCPHWCSKFDTFMIFCHRSDWFLYCIWHLHGQDGREGQTHAWLLQHPQWDCDETCHLDHVVSSTLKSHWLIFWNRNKSEITVNAKLFLKSLPHFRRLCETEFVSWQIPLYLNE